MRRNVEMAVESYLRERSLTDTWTTAFDLEFEIARLEGGLVEDLKFRRARRLVARMRAKGTPVVSSERGFMVARGPTGRFQVWLEIRRLLNTARVAQDKAQRLAGALSGDQELRG